MPAPAIPPDPRPDPVPQPAPVPAVPRVFVGRRMRFLSLKYPARLNYAWDAEVLAEEDAAFVWFTPGGAPFIRPTHTHRTHYDWIGVEWAGRWYSVTASFLPPHEVEGRAAALHHYYCNIALPGAWTDAARTTYRYVDLDLDVYVRPDGHADVLDTDEFEFHRRHFAYPRDMVAGARRAAREIVALARAGLPPFDGSLAAFHRTLYGPADARDAR